MAKTRAEIQIENRNKGRMKQAQWARHWHACAKFCCPEKAPTALNLAQTVVENYSPDPQRQNDTAIDGLRVLAGGIKSWVCPGPSQGWWEWRPHPALEDSEAVKEWLADCVTRADAAMHGGGFYDAAHLVFQDLGVLGTAGMMIDSTGDNPISFKAYSPTEFTFCLSWNNEVEEVHITYHKTAQQILDEFGKENVPDIIRTQCESNKGETSHEIIQAIFERPNEDKEKGGAEYDGNPMRMPYASVWIHVSTKKELKEQGYEEMPFVVPRWRSVTGSDGLYGIAPAMDALASARGVNLMDMLSATQVEVALNPRIKAPPGTGTIDLSPGGVTQISGSGEGPTEWLSDSTRGGIQAGEAFIARKEALILRCFHADLFEKLAPIAQKREMTNGLVDALERESLSRISPAMGQLSQGFTDPALLRIFMVLYRAGVFKEPPDEAFFTDTIGQRFFVFPRVAQTSRMAQALNNRKSFAFARTMERIGPLLPIRPDLLDLYDLDKIMRDLDRGEGMPSGWHLDEDQVAQIRQARAQQQQAMMQQQMALEVATKQPGLALQAASAMGGQGA